MRLIETPEDMAELMRECIKVTHHWIDVANDTFKLVLPYYKVVFSLKSGTAGRACYDKKTIQFNPTLLRENPEAFLARTPGHEVVHFACFAKYSTSVQPHGEEWKVMMRTLGLSDKRCHNYDTSRVPSKLGKVANKPNSYTITGLGVARPVIIGKVIELD